MRELGDDIEVELFSALDGTGVEQARARLADWLDAREST
jgi:hypothetical protein